MKERELQERENIKKYGSPERFDRTRRVEESSERPELNVQNRKGVESPRPDQPVEYDKPPKDVEPGKKEW